MNDNYKIVIGYGLERSGCPSADLYTQHLRGVEQKQEKRLFLEHYREIKYSCGVNSIGYERAFVDFVVLTEEEYRSLRQKYLGEVTLLEDYQRKYKKRKKSKRRYQKKIDRIWKKKQKQKQRQKKKKSK